MAHLTCTDQRDGVCLLIGTKAPESLCAHCQGDGTDLFRAGLAARKAKRELSARLQATLTLPLSQWERVGVRASPRTAARFPCARFGLEVDALFCAECRTNPALKQILASGRVSALRRSTPCIRKREQVGEREEVCCGGKTRMVPAYRCEGHLDAKTERDCARCGEFEPPSPFPLPGGEGKSACASWESLWEVHSGTTALVLACGPSVLLPGEDPGPDTVDPREVEADVVISTNWAWKWFGDVIDYQVSYDATPCFGWRPAGVKLLTTARPTSTQKLLDRAGVYCFFPSCDYGGIAQGKPLPCSRNSGYAALAFAAYAGCAAIKVLGMDFGPRDGRMHFYHESTLDVDRRVRSFARQRERVQADLTKLLFAVRKLGVTVENLASLPGLDWG